MFIVFIGSPSMKKVYKSDDNFVKGKPESMQSFWERRVADATPFRVGGTQKRLPRVARCSQPWAGCVNPFRIVEVAAVYFFSKINSPS
jgi:hypothetical protein